MHMYVMRNIVWWGTEGADGDGGALCLNGDMKLIKIKFKKKYVIRHKHQNIMPIITRHQATSQP